MSSHWYVNTVEPCKYLFVRHSLACVTLLFIMCDVNCILFSMFTDVVYSFDKGSDGSRRGGNEHGLLVIYTDLF